MKSSKPKIIAIVGTTSAGKTALAIDLARQFNGEVVSADSRQVYQGMNIGTGKVTKVEMAGVPHHLLDIVSPMEIYTGADFLQDSTIAINDIHARGKVPIIAGGTFFYLDLLRGKMQAAPVPPNLSLRAELEIHSDKELLEKLTAFDPATAARIDTDNRRRIIRALEICHSLGKVPQSVPQESPYEWLILGIDVPVDIVNERITTRLHERLKQGMIEEVEKLHNEGLSWERLDSFGLEYRYCGLYLRGELTKENLEIELSAKIRQYAKRQRTWLRRDPEIIWVPFPVNVDEVKELSREFLG